MHGPDQNFFAKWAEHIYAGSWNGPQNLSGRPFYVAPLYPWLISLSLHIKMHPFLSIHLLQITLSSAMIWILYQIGLLIRMPKVGLLSSFLWFFYGPSYFYDSCLIRASLVASFTGILLWICLLLISQEYRFKHAIWLGFVLGIQSLLRPSLFFVLIPLFLLVLGIAKMNRRILTCGIIVVLFAWITISPATYNNWMQSKTFVPISAQGVDSIILGNDITGAGVGFHPTLLSASWKQESHNQLSSVLHQIFLNTLSAPQQTARLYLRKFKMLLNHYEVPANYSYYLYKRLIPLAQIPFVGFGYLFPFCVLAFFVRSKDPKIQIIKFFLLISLGQALIIHIQSRYRFPAIIPMILLASLGVKIFIHHLRSGNYRRYLTYAILIALLIFYTLPYPSYGVRYATDAHGKRNLMSTTISSGDCITAILAFQMYGSTNNTQDIAELSIYAYKHYGVEFLSEFRKVSGGLLDSIKDEYKKQILSAKMEKLKFDVGLKVGAKDKHRP